MTTISLIGFGEAGQAFAGAAGWRASARAFDVATLDSAVRAAKLAEYEHFGVTGCETVAAALSGASLVLSLVTADQALAAAAAAAPHLADAALYCDMNSVAPATKAAAARLIEAAGGHYVDVAVMAPVHPARTAVPLLISGPHADTAAKLLGEAGFTKIDIAGESVGTASSIKMIRSVMVKGIEALTAECLLAAERAGVTDAVLASLGPEWAAKAEYNLDRMMVHGARRAAEMDEVVATLRGLAVAPLMSAATAERQRQIGALRLHPVPGLGAKLTALAAGRRELAA